MKIGSVRLPKNASRIISQSNRQYRVSLGAIAIETSLITLTFETQARLGTTWVFSGPFNGPPVISLTLQTLMGTPIFRDIAAWDVSDPTSTSIRCRLHLSSSSPRLFSVGDTAIALATATGEAP